MSLCTFLLYQALKIFQGPSAAGVKRRYVYFDKKPKTSKKKGNLNTCKPPSDFPGTTKGGLFTPPSTTYKFTILRERRLASILSCHLAVFYVDLGRIFETNSFTN